jgi:hypothetical protein
MRTIVYEQEADAAVDAGRLQYARVDDVMSGLEWRLSRRPTDGIPRKWGYHIYKQAGFKSLNIPTVTALYTYDDNQVVIYSVLFS